MISKNVFKGLLVYFLFTYAFQLIAYLLGFYNGVWSTSEKFHLLGADLTIIVISFLFLELLGFGKFVLTNIRKLTWLLCITKYKKIIIVLSLLSGLSFFLLNLGNYRYTGVSLSENISTALLLPIILKQFLYLFTLLEYYHKLNMDKSSFLSRTEKLMIILSQLFTVTGVTSALMLAITFIIFFIKLKGLGLLKIVIALILVPASLVLGLYVKWSPSSYNEFILSLNNIELKPYISYLVSRFSTTYYAHMHLINEDLNLYNNVQNLSIIFDNFFFRLNILLQKVFMVPKPDIASISQLNYETLALFQTNETSGSSPGIIPSFKYLFGNFWGNIFASFYLNGVIHSFLTSTRNPILGLLIGLLFFQSIFKAPFQILLIFDTNFIGFLCFLVAIIYMNCNNLSHNHV